MGPYTMRGMKPDIKCAAIGEGNLLLCCLQELLQREISVVTVFTNTDCVENFCTNNDIPHHKRNADLVDILKDSNIDYLFSVSNPRILKEDVLRIARQMTINYHDSPLPAYAGVHATSWAIINGEKQHGISWHVVEAGIDTGDILQKDKVDISDDDSALTLNLKCIETAKEAFRRLADNIICNNVERLQQPSIGRTYFGLYAIPSNLGLLKFTDSTETIYNTARALKFGNYENALGSPKIRSSTGHSLLVTNVEKVSATNFDGDKTVGSILEVIDDTIVVATQGLPLALSLAFLHGCPIPEGSLKDYGLAKGKTLNSSFDFDVDDLVAVRKKEAFWRRQSLNYEPTMFYRQKMNVVASIIEVSNHVNVRNITVDLPDIDDLYDGIDCSMYLQACFIGFLARINCTPSVHVGLLTDKKGISNDCRDLYSDIVPGIFNVDNDMHVEKVFEKCYSDLKLYKDSKTFLVDMLYRYPELRGQKRNPHHNIVISNIATTCTDNNLQAVLQDCNLVLLFGGKADLKMNVLFHERPAQEFGHVIDILQHFKTFMLAMTKGKETTPILKHIPLVTENELNMFYRPPEIPSESKAETISGLIDCQCKLTSFCMALKTTSGFMTYSKLGNEVNVLHQKLKGVVNCKQGKSIIGLHMHNSIAYVISMLAVAKSNMAFLPLPTDIPAERLCFTLKDAKVSQIIMTKDVFEKCDFNGMTIRMHFKFQHEIQDETIVFVEIEKEILQGSDVESDFITEDTNRHAYDDDDFLYLMYTSGSTGRPKGVKVRESGTINLARAQILSWDIEPGDIIAQFASIGFDASISEIFTALLSGGTLAVLGRNERLGSDFVTAMSKMKVSVITLPPSALNMYSSSDLPTLQKVVSAGEACTLNIAAKWTSADVRFFNAYGPTEGTVCATVFEYVSGINYEDVNRELPIGTAIHGVQVYLFDDFLRPVPPGVVGEIYIGGKGVAHGYIGHASKFTDQRFIQNPLIEQPSLLYKTGDHAFQDLDGNITYIGRTDDQVKIRGHRIDLSEIEQVLIQHPKIEMATVVVHRCSVNHTMSVAAYVSPTFIYVSELREYLQKALPKYMIPTYIQKIDVKDLPKTPNGKINRKELESDETIHQKAEVEEHSHLNKIQLIVANLWCHVFKFEAGFLYSLHRRSSFSELGGNSLQLVLLMRLLEDKLDVRLSFTDLGMADTIEEFAEVIRRRQDISNTATQNKLKSILELREQIFNDSEFDKSLNANNHRRRSVQIVQQNTYIPIKSRSEPRNVLLSGVTGFLGAFLLSEILEQSKAHVCCMVRESTEARGFGRVIDNMRKYSLWKFEYASRIAIVLSDLSQENLGIAPDIYKSLCNAVDVVFMNAAMMNFNTPYDDHRLANVIGTKEFIKFSSTGIKKHLFTTSSLSVFLFPPDRIQAETKRRVMTEADFFDDPLLIEGGYGQSKWASERLVMQALDSLPGGAIFRPARVSGRSTDGAGPRNDLFASTMIGMAKMGSYPDMDFPYDLTPVDFCAKSMIEVTLNIFRSNVITNMPKVYHVFNKRTIPFRELFEGMNLRALPLEEWRKELRQIGMDNKELLPLTPFFLSTFWDRAPDWPVFDTTNMDKVISEETKEIMKPTKELLSVYKTFFGV